MTSGMKYLALILLKSDVRRLEKFVSVARAGIGFIAKIVRGIHSGNPTICSTTPLGSGITTPTIFSTLVTITIWRGHDSEEEVEEGTTFLPGHFEEAILTYLCKSVRPRENLEFCIGSRRLRKLQRVERIHR